MEYEELEKLWRKYDEKLDNLGKINKKLIKETLLKKPTRKLNWHKFNSIYGLIIVPIVLVFALHPNFIQENLDWKLITGSILSLSVVIYVSSISIRSFKILKTIDLSNDSIINSTNKVIEFKKLFNRRWKHAFIYYPVLCVGVLLIAWNSFIFDTKTILSLIFIFIITYTINIYGPKIYRNRISSLHDDIMNLNEYLE